jgi:4-amino-4-deoxy-L-arabinose transferase-like glycosyltransferase
VALALVTVSGLVLGFLGTLGPAGFLSIHLALLGAVAALSGAGPWRSRARCLGRLIARPLGDVARGLARLAGPAASWPERLLSWAILGVFGLAVVLAALTPPLNGDTLAYRLPRIAWWLQEGHLGHIAAFDLSDARVNYTPFGPDLVMLWVVGFFPHGFPLIELPQLVGGALAGAGAYRLTLEVGLPRWAALAGVILLLGMPNVCVQLLTAQTDLYTAGCATAFLVFLLTALKAERTVDWILAGTALGLAVGAKGTMFYWAPGLLILLAVAALILRPDTRGLLRGMIAAGFVAVLLAGPAYVLSLRHYGNPFAPPVAIERVHVHPESSRLHLAAVNALTYAWQLLLPSSNFPFVRPPTSLAFEAGAEQIRALGEESPPFAGFVGNFEKNLVSMRRYMWHEDNLSMGVLAAILALIGGFRTLAGLRRGRRGRRGLLALALLASVAAFFVTFCLLQGWTPHKYRYFVLVAPVLAVLGARALAVPRPPSGGVRARFRHRRGRSAGLHGGVGPPDEPSLVCRDTPVP